jgi:hypothetical protein
MSRPQYGVLVMDTSMVRLAKECSSLAYFEGARGLRVRGANTNALACGTAIHEALAVYLKTGSAQKAIRKFHNLYYEAGSAAARADPKSRHGYENVRDILQEWFRVHPVAPQPEARPGLRFKNLPYEFYPGLIEVPFGMLLPAVPEEQVWTLVVGVLDALARSTSTGNWVVLDHKTVAHVDAQYRAGIHTDPQFTVYCKAAEAHLASLPPGTRGPDGSTRRVVEGAVVNAMEIGLLPGSDKRCARHGAPYQQCRLLHCVFDVIATERDAQEAQRCMDTFAHVVRQYWRVAQTQDIRQVPLDGRFVRGSCPRCSFSPVCNMADRDRALAAITEPNPWRPYPQAPAPGSVLWFPDQDQFARYTAQHIHISI